MDGLMKVGMRNRPERQHFALNILLNTYGSDLTTLKVGIGSMPLHEPPSGPWSSLL